MFNTQNSLFAVCWHVHERLAVRHEAITLSGARAAGARIDGWQRHFGAVAASSSSCWRGPIWPRVDDQAAIERPRRTVANPLVNLIAVPPSNGSTNNPASSASMPPATIDLPSEDQSTPRAHQQPRRRRAVGSVGIHDRHTASPASAGHDRHSTAVSRHRRGFTERTVGPLPDFGRLSFLGAPQSVSSAARRQVEQRRAVDSWSERTHARHRERLTSRSSATRSRTGTLHKLALPFATVATMRRPSALAATESIVPLPW